MLDNFLSMRILFFILFLIVGIAACKQEVPNPPESEKKVDLPVLQEINVEEAKNLIQWNRDENFVILDVRTPEEIKEGKLGGAVELDFYSDSFEEELSKLDRDKTYLLYCRSGNRSGQTADKMVEMGFKRLYNLDGGFTAWLETIPK